MNAEFNVWLLIVGLVVGAGLVWLVMMDGRRRESDVDAVELPREAAWLSAVLAEEGLDVSPEAAEQMLLLHRAYLGAPPPDPVVEESTPSDMPMGAAGSADSSVDASGSPPFEDGPPSPDRDEGPPGVPAPDREPVSSPPESD